MSEEPFFLSPDSHQVAFASYRSGHLDVYRKSLGASQDELVYSDIERKVPEWWLKDGTILFTENTGKDDFQIAPDGDRKPKKIFHTDFRIDEPSVSPDGRWIAFNSLESGQWEVDIAAFPSFSDKRQVSNSGGMQARWRADGKELYYLSPASEIMAVPVKTEPALEAGAPKLLFKTHIRPNALWDQYGVTADGQKFLVAEPVKDIPKPITVILNWPALIHRDAP